MVSEGIFINGEKVTFNPENILNGDTSAYTEEIGEATREWLEEHLEPGGSVPIDDTLSIAGAAADAKKTGDEIGALKSDLSEKVSIEQGTAHAGEALIIGADGKVTTGEAGVSVDPTLTIEGKAADAKATGDKVSGIIDSSALFDDFANTPTYNANYYSGGVKEWGTAKRVINTTTLSYPVQVKLSCADGYTFGVEELVEPYTFTGNYKIASNKSSGGQVTEYICDADANILVVLRRTDLGAIEPTVWADVMSIEMYPHDLTELTEVVNALGESSEHTDFAISSIENNGYIGIEYTLVDGGINANNGSNYGGGGDATYLATHKRTPDYITLEAGKKYVFKAPVTPADTKVAYYRYNADTNAYLGTSGFGYSYAYTADATEKVRLAFTNDNEALDINSIYQNAIIAPLTPVVQMIVEDSGVPSYATPNEFSSTVFFTETSETAQPAQGMCTDGTYIYCAKQVGSPNAEIIKINIETGEVVLRNTGEWGHANDIAYDTQNNYLLVMMTTAKSIMAKIDADTLTTVDTVDFRSVAHGLNESYEFVGITYMDEYDRYIFTVANGKALVGFAFMLSDFTLEKFVKIVPTTHIAQNVDYVNGMIAVSDYYPGNRIIYYNFNGQKINEIVTSYGSEFEALAHVGDVYYLYFNSNAYKTIAVYKCETLGYNYMPMALVQSQYVP